MEEGIGEINCDGKNKIKFKKAVTRDKEEPSNFTAGYSKKCKYFLLSLAGIITSGA